MKLTHWERFCKRRLYFCSPSEYLLEENFLHLVRIDSIFHHYTWKSQMDGQDQIFLNIPLKYDMKFSHKLGMTSLCKTSGPINSMAWSSLIRIISLLKNIIFKTQFYTTTYLIKWFEFSFEETLTWSLIDLTSKSVAFRLTRLCNFSEFSS